MRIQELEHLVGIERATIRYYEKEGLIEPKRSENGYRDYSDSDAAELRRIRLLRDLGISLETIRNLQQGREDMSAVMEQQRAVLANRQQQMERARAVCEQISSDGVSYLGLDTARYQNLLTLPPQSTPLKETVFREYTPREPHPWWRYFARMLDHAFTAAAVWLVVVVVLRWRPAENGLNAVTTYAAWFIMMPLEALCLSLWGTTPGKWVFGIRVEAVEGGYLSFSEALRRAWSVFYSGTGMGVPLLNYYCMYKAYRTHSDTWDTEWDLEHECEISFHQCGWRNILLGVLMYAAAVGMNTTAALNAELPKYRSSELTVAQFASNFNFYDLTTMNNTTEHMDRSGVLADPGYIHSMVLPDYGEVEYDPNGQFEFETEGNAVRKITYHHSWYEYDSVFYQYDAQFSGNLDALYRWIPGHCQLAITTAILSQDSDYAALLSYGEQMKEDLKKPTGDGLSFTYGNVTVSWNLGLEPFADYADDSSYPDVYHVTLDMAIEYR